MNNSKIFQVSKSSVPLQWSGKFDGIKLEEKITYDDGSELEMILTLNNESSTIENKLNDVFHFVENNEDDFEDEEELEINDMYVMVEEDGNAFPIHKDILPDYMEMVSMDLKTGM